MRPGAGLAALLALAGANAVACGVCIEDKVAATYDHAVIERAVGAGRVVVFAEVRSPQPAKDAVRAARRGASGVRGVDPASVRGAEEPAALSFSLDARVRTPAQALVAAQAAARSPGLELRLLKVLP